MTIRSITIAIDFGTTFSGCTWSSGSRDINQVRSWPGIHGQYDKVPTVLYYDPANPAEPVSWGFDVRPEMQKIEWFKLHLGNTPMPALPFGLTAADVITKYLSRFRTHCESQLTSGYGACIPAPVWAAHKHNVQYVLTVPANWDDRANNIMQSCFRNAGYAISSPGQLKLVTEPEAAANYYAREQREFFNWQVGDHLMIVDAGGGTVDVIIYVVRTLQPFVVDEAVTGEARFAGATFLDRGFKSLIQRKCAALPSSLAHLPQDILKTLLTTWQTWKLSYDSSQSSDILHRVLPEGSDYPEADIINGTIRISALEMRGIFDPVCNDILGLVNSQLDRLYRSQSFVANKSRLFPILVGGFGQSNYLNQVLRTQLRPDFVKNIGRFGDCWRAVVCGALVAGQVDPGNPGGSFVGAHVARRHYLIRCKVPYEPHLHNGGPFVVSTDYITREQTVETTHAFCTMNQIIKLNDYFDQKFSRVVDEGQPMVFRTTLFDSDAPGGAPLQIDARCRQLCILEADLRSIPIHSLPRMKVSSGIFNKKYRYKVSYTLRLMVGHGAMILELWFNGNKMGQNAAKIEYT